VLIVIIVGGPAVDTYLHLDLAYSLPAGQYRRAEPGWPLFRTAVFLSGVWSAWAGGLSEPPVGIAPRPANHENVLPHWSRTRCAPYRVDGSGCLGSSAVCTGLCADCWPRSPRGL